MQRAIQAHYPLTSKSQLGFLADMLNRLQFDIID